MKEILTLVFCVSFMCLNSQNKTGNVGVKGGLNFSSFSGNSGADLSARVSFHAGLILESKLSDKLSLQPEFLFSSQGSNEKFDGVYLENRLNYITLPVLIKFYISEKISFNLGPQVGVLVSGRQSSTSTADNDIQAFFNNTDYGLKFGLGYKFDNGLSFSVEYQLGLRNIRNTDTFNNYNDKLRNSVFQLSLGYYFKTKNNK